MFDKRLKARAELAEANLAKAQSTIEMIEQLMNDRAALISIVRTGRMVRFGFARRGKVHYIEMVGTWDDDVEQWKRDLLGKTDG